MEKSDPSNDVESLADMFKEGLDLYTELNKTNEPSNSPQFQANLRKAISILENATRLVSLSGIFSRNEEVEEVATTDLQYFLLPALLGSLNLKLTTRDRKEVVDVAEVYFNDFLQRCTDYGLTNYKKSTENRSADSEQDNRTELEKLAEMANTRANKIQRFNEKKELQSKLETLKENMSNENVDEETKRNYFLTMLKLYIHEAIDELQSIDIEKPILEHMASIKNDERSKPKRMPVQPLRPVIITKDEVQKAVFGAGYPSLPTMTVQEFYDKRVREGIFPDPSKQPAGPTSLQEASLAGMSLNDEGDEIEKENKIENDDEETLARARAMDEFKDDHRRGWGNRMNRS
ncbi:immunoglobulin-binding protein 1 [Agrilus planipennis]|uniref:Immunoglobulin-binding protein 1 n=1 Tax=Agrilus planipennis TaxID=224129 RepID=A0A1W4XVL4_AGRPL|nr:immunoglobulin-binding protein 1 [Agrilus planipennis]